MAEFYQSLAKDFLESPACERGCPATCKRKGWSVASVSLDLINGFTSPVPPGIRGWGYAGNGSRAPLDTYFGNSLPLNEHCAIPGAHSYRMEMDLNVSALPTIPNYTQTHMMFRLWVNSTPSWDYFGTTVPGSDQQRFHSPDPRFYRDGGDTGTTFTESAQPYNTNVTGPPIQYSFTVPWVIGPQSRVFYLSSRPNCYYFFNIAMLTLSWRQTGDPFTDWFLGGQGFGENSYIIPRDPSSGIDPGALTAEFRMYRIQRMIVRYAVTTQNATVGQNLQFTDISITDNTKTAWLWDFGDGTTSTMQNPTKSYASPGSYQVRLTITDNSKLSYSAEGAEIKTIRVT